MTQTSLPVSRPNHRGNSRSVTTHAAQVRSYLWSEGPTLLNGTYRPEQRLARAVIGTIIVGNRKARTRRVNGKTFDLIDPVAVQLAQIGQQVAHQFLGYNRQCAAKHCRNHLSCGNTVDLFDIRLICDLIVALD